MNVTIPNTGGGQQQPTSITPTPNTTILRDANGRSQVAVPAVAADIARLDTVTATQVGLGNVTNESKITMFTNPSFTGRAGIGTTVPNASLHVNDRTGIIVSGAEDWLDLTPFLVEVWTGGYVIRRPILTVKSNSFIGINTNMPTTQLDVNSDRIRIRTPNTPTSATAPGNVGDICWDAGFVYVCTATNTWRRSALTAW